MTNFHKLGDLKQQEFIHSQFWGPEILTRGEGRATPPPKAAGKNSSCLLWFPVAPATLCARLRHLSLYLLLTWPLPVCRAANLPLPFSDIRLHFGPSLSPG